MKRLENLLRSDEKRMDALRLVNELQFKDCYIAAGFLRNLVWDNLHNISSPLNDIDVIFYDPSDVNLVLEKGAEAHLKRISPSNNWQVKNQAFMHIKNGDKPYKSSYDAMNYWPEKETAIASRLVNEKLDIITPFDLSSVFQGNITHNKNRHKHIFLNRIHSKGWLQQWPQLQVKL